MRIQEMTAAQFERRFPDEDACARYLIKKRWPRHAHCPRCGFPAKPLATMKYKWECYHCRVGNGYRFSHIAGTIFEHTNKPLRDWFRVLHILTTSETPMSASAINRAMGFGSYRTALRMCRCLRKELDGTGFTLETNI